MKPSALLCFLAAVATALAADAAGTNTVEKFAYRGTLANADGSAFASAIPMQMTFRLYDRETGGTPLWGRTLPVRVETNGTFYAELSDGEGSPSDKSLPYGELAQALAACDGTCWIGFAPDDYSEMAPRQRLASVPRALRAVTASKITGFKAGSLSAETVQPELATVGDLTVKKSLQEPENVLLSIQGEGRLAATLVQLNKAPAVTVAHASKPEQITDLAGPSDKFWLCRSGDNIYGIGKVWTVQFFPASDTPSETMVRNPDRGTIYSFGRNE